MTARKEDEIYQKIRAGMRVAIAAALEEHRKAGRLVAVWKDGKAVRLPVEEALKAAREAE